MRSIINAATIDFGGGRDVHRSQRCQEIAHGGEFVAVLR